MKDIVDINILVISLIKMSDSFIYCILDKCQVCFLEVCIHVYKEQERSTFDQTCLLVAVLDAPDICLPQSLNKDS